MNTSYLFDRITIDDGICNEKPTIRNLRINVETIVDFLAMGDSHVDILKVYPDLTNEDIDACLKFTDSLKDNYLSISDIKKIN